MTKDPPLGWCFQIDAHADPSVLPRVINYFTQIGVVPHEVRVDLVEDGLAIFLAQAGLEARQARIIAEKMRSVPLIRSVELHQDFERHEIDDPSAPVESDKP